MNLTNNLPSQLSSDFNSIESENQVNKTRAKAYLRILEIDDLTQIIALDTINPIFLRLIEEICMLEVSEIIQLAKEIRGEKALLEMYAEREHEEDLLNELEDRGIDFITYFEG